MQNHKIKSKYHKLVEVKIPKHAYNKEQLDIVFDSFKNEEDIDLDKLSERSGMSRRRLKKLRYIHRKGSPEDLELLYECKYLISNIEKDIKLRSTFNSRNLRRMKKYENME